MWTVTYALKERRIEIYDWREWLLLPWWLLRYGTAWVKFKVLVQWDKVRKRPFPGLRGRHDDPSPVMCPRCLWAGAYSQLLHTYSAVLGYDVEPVDECPRCGEEL